MTTKRKTSIDYKRQLTDLKLQQTALENRIIARCIKMITENPNVHMSTINYPNAGKSVVFTKDYLPGIECFGMYIIFKLMEAIEADLASKQVYIQKTIEF